MAQDDETNKPAESNATTRLEAPGPGSIEKRKRSYASNSTLYVLFTIGALVLVNLLGTRMFKRLDLTQNGVYTLSPASKDVVRALPDYLTVKAYISKDLPDQLSSLSRYVRDLMDEYRNSSNGKLRFEAYDPVADKKEDEAAQCKVNKLQVQVLHSQKFEVGSYYLGLCLQYNGQSEAIAEISQPEGLEYRVSSLMKRMTQKKRKVAFTTGHGEQDLNQGFQFLKPALEQEFDTTTVNPSTTPIAADVDALVVGGPKQAFDDKGRREIDAFLMKGKGVVFMVDGMTMSSPRQGGMPPEMQQAQPKIGQANDAGLGEILEKYGFKVDQDFVLDGRQNVPGPIELGGRRMLASRPEFVGVKPEEVEDKDFSVLTGVNAVVFPFGSSVELVGPLAGGKAPAGARLWTLAKTSSNAWKQTGFFFFNPSKPAEEGKEKGSVALAYAYQGVLKSAYPPPTQGAMSNPEPQANQPPSESSKPVRLVMVGDSDFASDEYMQLARFLPFYQGGAQLLFNAIGWTIEDEALTPVRAKTVSSRPIEVESDSKVAAVKAFNIAGVPLLFIGFGLLRWRIRRGQRQGQTL
jgi:gliding-associated putative ABC transporter substrate-binding component GldG